MACQTCLHKVNLIKISRANILQKKGLKLCFKSAILKVKGQNRKFMKVMGAKLQFNQIIFKVKNYKSQLQVKMNSNTKSNLHLSQFDKKKKTFHELT
jgi:hypothetical protein